MSVVSLSGISKSYRRQRLFGDVTFSLEKGSCTALVGPNGSGKSVLMRIICGFTKPDSGTVSIDPLYLAEGAHFPAGFGVMIDRPGYISHLSGLRNLMELARIRGVVGEIDVRAWMEKFGLDPDSSTKAGRFSLGMKQKLALCQAVMEGQQVLILDEPFNALDDTSQSVIREVMRDHIAKSGTVLFTSHNANDVGALATRVLKIDGGQVVESDV